MLVRYFAAARAAAGVEEELHVLPEGTSLERCWKLRSPSNVHCLPKAPPPLARIVARSSFLRNEVAVRDRAAPLGSDDIIDVLPPLRRGARPSTGPPTKDGPGISSPAAQSYSGSVIRQRPGRNAMYTLQIEHGIKDFDMWKAAFDRDPLDRAGSGVQQFRVSRPAEGGWLLWNWTSKRSKKPRTCLDAYSPPYGIRLNAPPPSSAIRRRASWKRFTPEAINPDYRQIMPSGTHSSTTG